MQPLERHRSIEGMTALEVSDREPWRAWLATHHASEAEVWLVYYKGAQAKDGIGYGESVEEALCFGWIDGLVRRIDDDRYMRRFTPRKPKSKWSASNKVRVERLLEEGRMATPGKKIIDAARTDGSWDEIPDAERRWEMPNEFQRALDQDHDARSAFESASPSHRKQFVMWVASAKRSETRDRRAARAVGVLRSGNRPV